MPGSAQATPGAQAVGGAMELASLPSSGFLGRSLGEGRAAQGPARGVEEISIPAPNRPPGETFPTMSSKVPLLGIPFGKGVERQVWGGGCSVS